MNPNMFGCSAIFGALWTSGFDELQQIGRAAASAVVSLLPQLEDTPAE